MGIFRVCVFVCVCVCVSGVALEHLVTNILLETLVACETFEVLTTVLVKFKSQGIQQHAD